MKPLNDMKYPTSIEVMKYIYHLRRAFLLSLSVSISDLAFKMNRNAGSQADQSNKIDMNELETRLSILGLKYWSRFQLD